jgi:hypothetical protein
MAFCFDVNSNEAVITFSSSFSTSTSLSNPLNSDSVIYLYQQPYGT